MIRVKKILCPIDFFPASVAAAQYAAGLAASYGATIHLLHVVTPIPRTAYEYSLDLADITRTLEKASAAQMTKIVKELQARGVDVRSETRTGDVQDVIQRAIATLKPDLVTVGTHGRRGVERWVMGSVAEWLARHSSVPILTLASIAKPDRQRVRRIMVTTDFSDGTADALNYALSIAEGSNAEITLVHIVDPSTFELSGKYRDMLMKGLEDQLRDLIPAGVREQSRVETKIKHGVPYRMILKMLEMEKCDLLVMNVRGKGKMERALLGSTAECVIRGARCPVLLIPEMSKAKAVEKPLAKTAAA